MGSPRVVCGAGMLIGAMNPCPCGYYGDPTHECTCSAQMITRYQKRISGPLLDRMAHRSALGPPEWAHVEVPAADYEKLSDERLGEPSAAVRARVDADLAGRMRGSDSGGALRGAG